VIVRKQQEFMDGIQDFSEVYCDDFYTDKDGQPTNILQSFSQRKPDEFMPPMHDELRDHSPFEN
jgi:hypothetical protein